MTTIQNSSKEKSGTPMADAPLPGNIKKQFGGMRDRARQIERDLIECADALRALRECQNGAPSFKKQDLDDWNKAMAAADAILAKLGK
jgi:hypothetical protein